MKQVTCWSGIKGWRERLQKVYASCDEFIHYSELYSLHIRLGFHTPEEAWTANPLIEGSVIHTDYRTIDI
jgi:hypothetical protein